MGDLPAGVACAGCYRVEIYQYAINSTLIILVDLASGRVVDAQSTPNSQPEVPKALADLAVQIAVVAPEVAQALGVAPDFTPGVNAADENSTQSHPLFR